MVYEFSERESNIEQFLGIIIEVKEIKIEASQSGSFSLTTLNTDKGEITTTSEIIRKQAEKLQKDGNIPFKAKIIRRGEGNYRYFSFAKPVL